MMERFCSPRWELHSTKHQQQRTVLRYHPPTPNDPFPADIYLKGNKSLKIGMLYIKLFVMMVAMDTKFGRIYRVISDVRFFLYIQLQLPHIK